MLSKDVMENLKSLEEKAAKGDAGAQYRLAAVLAQAGRTDEAGPWLQKAAAAGHPGALYTQATEMLSKPPEEMDPPQIAALLERAANAGGAAAARQLAVLKALGLGTLEDWSGAVRLVIKAAQAGHPAAYRELALLSHLTSTDQMDYTALLRIAAMKGDWAALYLALRKGGVFNAGEGAGLAAQLKKGGAPLADRLRDPVGEASAAPTVDYVALEKAAIEYAPARLSAPKWLNQHPDILSFQRFLSVETCDYLICAAAGLLKPSRVVNSKTSASDHAQYRSSDGAILGLVDLDLALIAIYQRLALAADAPVGNCELMGVLRYRPGQEYLPHHDYLPEDASDYSEIKRAGQRACTVLVPLNDGYEGGETRFPELDISVMGAAGDALVFHNIDQAGAPLPQSLHAGLAVTAGEKWILTLWVRERRFWFWS